MKHKNENVPKGDCSLSFKENNIKFNRHYTSDDIKKLFNKKVDTIIEKCIIKEEKEEKDLKNKKISKQTLITNYF